MKKGSISDLDKGTARMSIDTVEVVAGEGGDLLIGSHSTPSEVFDSPPALACFRSFLQREHSEENLLFYDVVNPIIKGDKEATVQDVQAIITRFVGEMADDQINIPSAQVNDINAALQIADEGKKLSQCLAVLATMLEEVYKLICRDSFFRFFRSPEWAAFVLEALVMESEVEILDADRIRWTSYKLQLYNGKDVQELLLKDVTDQRLLGLPVRNMAVYRPQLNSAEEARYGQGTFTIALGEGARSLTLVCRATPDIVEKWAKRLAEVAGCSQLTEPPQRVRGTLEGNLEVRHGSDWKVKQFVCTGEVLAFYGKRDVKKISPIKAVQLAGASVVVAEEGKYGKYAFAVREAGSAGFLVLRAAAPTVYQQWFWGLLDGGWSASGPEIFHGKLGVMNAEGVWRQYLLTLHPEVMGLAVSDRPSVTHRYKRVLVIPLAGAQLCVCGGFGFGLRTATSLFALRTDTDAKRQAWLSQLGTLAGVSQCTNKELLMTFKRSAKMEGTLSIRGPDAAWEKRLFLADLHTRRLRIYDITDKKRKHQLVQFSLEGIAVKGVPAAKFGALVLQLVQPGGTGAIVLRCESSKDYSDLKDHLMHIGWSCEITLNDKGSSVWQDGSEQRIPEDTGDTGFLGVPMGLSFGDSIGTTPFPSRPATPSSRLEGQSARTTPRGSGSKRLGEGSPKVAQPKRSVYLKSLDELGLPVSPPREGRDKGEGEAEKSESKKASARSSLRSSRCQTTGMVKGHISIFTGKEWEEKFFILSDYVLELFEAEDAKEPTLHLQMFGASVTKLTEKREGKEGALVINPAASNESLLLWAQESADMDLWTNALSQSAERRRKQSVQLGVVALMQGYLRIKSHSKLKKKWGEMRWCVLDAAMNIQVFNEKHDPGPIKTIVIGKRKVKVDFSDTKGTLKLKKTLTREQAQARLVALVDPTLPYPFEVRTQAGKDYKFCAMTRIDRGEWMKALKNKSV